MAQRVHEETKAYTTRWDDDVESVVHEWNQYVDGDLFRDGCESMLEAIEAHDSSTVLIDHRDMKIVDQEDHEYIIDEWVPRAVEAGCTHHIVVHQESTIAEMNLDNVIDLPDYDYVSELTSDIDFAREWVAER